MLEEWLSMQAPLGWIIGIILAIVGGIMQGYAISTDYKENHKILKIEGIQFVKKITNCY
jgi:hypothetical protein